jgi:hypothetical protein
LNKEVSGLGALAVLAVIQYNILFDQAHNYFIAVTFRVIELCSQEPQIDLLDLFDHTTACTRMQAVGLVSFGLAIWQHNFRFFGQ